MKTLEFLNQLVNILPVSQCECLTFKENVFIRQKEFLNEFSLVDDNDLKLFLRNVKNEKQLSRKIMINKFKQIHQKLNNAIEFFYEGKPAEAYKQIKQLLANRSYIRDLDETYKDYLGIMDYRSSENLNWYRLRELSEEERKNPKASYLFHPPFEKRGKVGNYRFSISGFPCLYLGDTIKTCWEENNQNTDNIFACRLTLPGDQSFLRPLNITIPKPFTEEIYVADNPLRNDAFNFLITFPILQLCLFKVNLECIKDSFKPEYIIPQLLLQFVRDNSDKCDGNFYNSVVYSSTRISDEKYNHNLVLPVRKVLNWGYCPKLKKTIKITDPIKISSFDLDNLQKVEKDLQKMDAIYLP